VPAIARRGALGRQVMRSSTYLPSAVPGPDPTVPPAPRRPLAGEPFP